MGKYIRLKRGFTINLAGKAAPKVKEAEQATFSFELPLTKFASVQDETKILFELSNETKNIIVHEPVEMVSITELSDNGIIKYSLEEYMEIENDLLNSKPVEKPVVEPIQAELNITVKKT